MDAGTTESRLEEICPPHKVAVTDAMQTLQVSAVAGPCCTIRVSACHAGGRLPTEADRSREVGCLLQLCCKAGRQASHDMPPDCLKKQKIRASRLMLLPVGLPGCPDMAAAQLKLCQGAEAASRPHLLCTCNPTSVVGMMLTRLSTTLLSSRLQGHVP